MHMVSNNVMRLRKPWPRWKFILFGFILVTMVTVCAISVLIRQHEQQEQDCDYNNQSQFIEERKQEKDGPWTHHQMHEVCRQNGANDQCPRAKRPLLAPLFRGRVNMSSCDDQATVRGLNQKVVAYSLYGDMYSKYFNGTRYNIEAVAKFYPGWVMRLYHNLNVSDQIVSNVLCDMWCNNEHIDICDVRQLPAGLGDQHKIFGMIWRFFVMGDPLVERFIIRDIDSQILQREVDAVDAWINSGVTWHIMRDHIYHTVPILGGMWGGTNKDLRKNVLLRDKFIQRGIRVNTKDLDQDLLREILWPLAQKDMLAHDGYCCKKFKGSQPWPTRRQTMEFVGDKFPWENTKRFKVEVCPIECRPKHHTDWKYC